SSSNCVGPVAGGGKIWACVVTGGADVVGVGAAVPPCTSEELVPVSFVPCI
ncbi:hypothetical protein NDU88_004370, partial [Pleurodeles waltl]